MNSSEQIALLESGDIDAWNRWRERNPDATIDLVGANLQGANLQEADLHGAKLYKANLKGADLQGAKLQGAKLQGADLIGADLIGADLQGADLHKADLKWARLSKANLQGANLPLAELYKARLQGANLQEALLPKADLRVANLQEANLHRANLQGANLKGANLQGANLHRANLQGAVLRGATYNRHTRWSDPFRPPDDANFVDDDAPSKKPLEQGSESSQPVSPPITEETVQVRIRYVREQTRTSQNQLKAVNDNFLNTPPNESPHREFHFGTKTLAQEIADILKNQHLALDRIEYSGKSPQEQIKELMEENAALKKRVAELEAKAKSTWRIYKENLAASAGKTTGPLIVVSIAILGWEGIVNILSWLKTDP